MVARVQSLKAGGAVSRSSLVFDLTQTPLIPSSSRSYILHYPLLHLLPTIASFTRYWWLRTLAILSAPYPFHPLTPHT